MKILFQVIVPALFLFCIFAAVPAQAQLAVVQSDIDFGTSDAPSGSGTGTNSIGTNGTISYAAGYTGPATGVAGRILINGTVGRRTRISCSTTKTMRNVTGSGGSANLSATPFYIVLGTSNAGAPGTGLVCNGLNNYLVDQNLPAAAADRTILIGMTMDVTNVMNGGQYALSNSGSGEFQVRVVQSGGGPTQSITVNVDAFAVFNKDVAITGTTDMDFGIVNYTGTPGPGDEARMGTNGSIGYTGGFNGTGSGTSGRVELSGVPNGTTLEVYCSNAAVLSNGMGSSIQLTDIEVAREGRLRNFGSNPTCNGLTGAAAMTYSFRSGTRDEIFFGGRLDGGTMTGSAGGNYSTANAGGSPIDAVVVIQ